MRIIVNEEGVMIDEKVKIRMGDVREVDEIVELIREREEKTGGLLRDRSDAPPIDSLKSVIFITLSGVGQRFPWDTMIGYLRLRRGKTCVIVHFSCNEYFGAQKEITVLLTNTTERDMLRITKDAIGDLRDCLREVLKMTFTDEYFIEHIYNRFKEIGEADEMTTVSLSIMLYPKKISWESLDKLYKVENTIMDARSLRDLVTKAFPKIRYSGDRKYISRLIKKGLPIYIEGGRIMFDSNVVMNMIESM